MWDLMWISVLFRDVVGSKVALSILVTGRGRGHAQKWARANILGHISKYLADSHQVYPKSVRWCTASVGAMTGNKHLRGKLVFLQSTAHVWDQRAITSTCLHDARFAADCYHVNRLFVLCAGWSNTEAPNERWIGHLKYLYNPIHGETTTTLTQRCRGYAAGLRGGIVDEDVMSLLSASHPT